MPWPDESLRSNDPLAGSKFTLLFWTVGADDQAHRSLLPFIWLGMKSFKREALLNFTDVFDVASVSHQKWRCIKNKADKWIQEKPKKKN